MGACWYPPFTEGVAGYDQANILTLPSPFKGEGFPEDETWSFPCHEQDHSALCDDDHGRRARPGRVMMEDRQSSKRRDKMAVRGQRAVTSALIAVILCIPVFCSMAGYAASGNITLVSSDDAGLILEVITSPFEIREVPYPQGLYTRILLPGWAKTSRKGYPELPLTAALLQVPEQGDITIRIMDEETESIPNCTVHPVPELGLSESGEIISTCVRNEAVYRASGFFPDTVARIDSRGIVRGVPVARIMISPFQWNPATGELRCSKRLLIRIGFENPASSTRQSLRSATARRHPDPYEALKQKALINYRPGEGKKSGTIAAVPTRQSASSPSDGESLRIEVTREGLYRLTYPELEAQGIDAGSIDPATFRLFNNGTETAIKVVPGDSIEFYGTGINTPYTGTNVYRLFWGEEPGKRMGEIDGAVTGQGSLKTSFGESLHLEENHTPWGLTPGAPSTDYWFWEKLTAPQTASYTVDIPSPVRNQDSATVRIGYQGRSTGSPHPNHCASISLNGIPIGEASWDNDIAHTQEATAAQIDLLDGNNTIRIDSGGNAGDVLYLNWIEVEYRRELTAEDNELAFTAEGDGSLLRMEIAGFGDEDVSIYEVTDPYSVNEVNHVTVQQSGQEYEAVFECSIGESKAFYAVTEECIQSPDAMSLRQAADLKAVSNGADYILITDEDFLPSVDPLCQVRLDQGLRVKAVSVQDIFDEFNYGIFDPAAVKEFLKYAYESWERPAPTYVFLVGDANFDYRDYFESGKKNRAPVHLGITAGLGLTPDDNWYACMDGENDIIPDMFIGRIPGSSAAMVEGIVNKILACEELTGYEPKTCLFAADDEQEFEDIQEGLAGYLPSGFGAHKVYLRTYQSVDDATSDILSCIDDGMLITTYLGHGSVTNWAGEFLFESADVDLLDNADKPTFVLALDCLNGFFGQAMPGDSHYSLGQEFVLAQDKGAIAHVAPSGLSYTWEHEILGKKVFEAIFEQGDTIVGAITTQSKIAAYAGGISDESISTFTLFGDPATGLKYGDGNGDDAAVFTIAASSGEHGIINPSGDVLIDEGADQAFAVIPNTGYQVADVLADGQSVGSVTAYTFSGVTADHTITATFAESSTDDDGGGCFLSTTAQSL